MAFTLEKVVPWGRSYEEYQRMFALTDVATDYRILGCADGPASFNAEASRKGAHVVSCDPLYRYSGCEIRRRIDETFPEMIEQARQNHSDFVWTEFSSPEAVGEARMKAMQAFLDDFDEGLREGRYIDAELPWLPFEDNAFDLALCSHFLFLYSEQLTEDFHVNAIREMARVAGEVRIFPVVALGGIRSKHLSPVGCRLQDLQLSVTVESVPYEFVRNSNEMMRVRE